MIEAEPQDRCMRRITLSTVPESRDLKHWHFADVGCKGLQFCDYDFSYTVMTRVYLRNTVFRNCNFTGARIIDSNFRGAKFHNCDFRYASFVGTNVDRKQIMANLPDWPNVRREFLQRMRVNAASIGDYDAEKAYVREELEAERDHWRRARRKNERYYREHYPGALNWFSVRLRCVWLWLDSVFWGHGEKPYRSIGFAVTILFALAFSLTIFQLWSSDSTIYHAGVTTWVNFINVISVFLDLGDPSLISDVHAILVLVVLFRYFLLGVIFAALYRRMARR